MPDEAKKQIRAARVNVMLVRYTLVILFAFVFLALLLAGSYVVLAQTKQSAETLISANDTKAEVYSTTKAQVDALSSSLSETRTILDQEILYSNVLMNIGQQMTPGTVLEKVSLDATNFTGTPIALKAYAKDNAAAVALREKFQSSPFFSGVNFESVSEAGSGVAGYPTSVSLTLTLNRSASE